ncbi:MAG: hypothetical protein DI535_20570 [Citrobacter freundii]|nr:MAG: hypothetical protein DI535_20570 [Citrobacter freundii]
MKILFIFSFTLVTLASCSKRDVPAIPVKPPVNDYPQMIVTELNDLEVEHNKSQRVDLDHDGVFDITFAVWYIGNPNEHEDELLYFAASGTESALMMGGENDSPRFSKNDVIAPEPTAGYEWYIVSQAEMAKKNIGFVGQPYWEKSWKDASHKFLAIRVQRNAQWYYGWVEVSMDTNKSRLILHRAGISKVADKAVKAGV